MNGAVLVLISFAVFGLGYGLYSRFLAAKVLALDAGRETPAVRLEDGRDYVPTPRWVTFFYHFATISGSGGADARRAVRLAAVHTVDTHRHLPGRWSARPRYLGRLCPS